MTVTLDPAARRGFSSIMIVDADARVIAASSDVRVEAIADRIRALVLRHMNGGVESPDATVDVLDESTALRVVYLRGDDGPLFAVTLERADRQRSAVDAICAEHGLTARERQVLGMLLTGSSNREISEKLIIALTTARDHTANIFRKTGSTRRTQLLARVIAYDERFAAAGSH